MHLIIFAGTFMAVNGTGTVRLAGVFLAGFGNAGWAPALFTMPMEFEDMNPARVGAVYAVMLSAGFLAAFVSPWAGGWLGQQIGLHDTIFYFSFSSLIAALCTFMMEETGPGLKRQEILWKES
jgi:MFS family permease